MIPGDISARGNAVPDGVTNIVTPLTFTPPLSTPNRTTPSS